ncbi:unnamed protein product [Ectocarpus fasciculatus]
MYHQPSDFMARATGVVDKCRVLRDKVRNAHSSRYILEHLDGVSREICSVIDSAEFTRNAHYNQSYRQAADGAFEEISKLIHDLNADSSLYEKLDDARSPLQSLDAPTEDYLFAADLKREFETDGVHLSTQLKEELARLQERVMIAEMSYGRNVQITEARELFTVLLPPHLSELGAAIKQFLEHNNIPQTEADAVGCPEGAYPLVMSVQASVVLISSIDVEEARRIIYMAMRNANKENIAGLGELIQSRHRLARHLEFKSYGHKYLANKIYKTPTEVLDFLRSTNELIAPQAKQEFAQLLNTKHQLDHNKLYAAGDQGEPTSENAELNLWDMTYVSAVDASRCNQSFLRQLSPYFPISTVLDGMCMIARELFGLDICVSSRFDPGEAWCRVRAQDGSPLLYKFLIRNVGDSTVRAVVYFDLFSRAHKFSGAAHFNVRSGCSNVTPGANLVTSDSPSSDQKFWSESADYCLSFEELQTLYHEFGHSLHSVLSVTHYQHLAGTRGPPDFAEIPSHLFEYFARDPRVLSQWARHHCTGEPIPHDLLLALGDHRNPHAAMQTQLQLLYAAVDQVSNTNKLHVEFLKDTYAQPVPAEGGQAEELSVLNLRMHNHFVGYGGGYYCYTFSKMCAAQIWEHHLAADPLNRQKGSLLHDKLFCQGGALTAEGTY